jgi:hypothetical protein
MCWLFDGRQATKEQIRWALLCSRCWSFIKVRRTVRTSLLLTLGRLPASKELRATFPWCREQNKIGPMRELVRSLYWGLRIKCFAGQEKGAIVTPCVWMKESEFPPIYPDFIPLLSGEQVRSPPTWLPKASSSVTKFVWRLECCCDGLKWTQVVRRK